MRDEWCVKIGKTGRIMIMDDKYDSTNTPKITSDGLFTVTTISVPC